MRVDRHKPVLMIECTVHRRIVQRTMAKRWRVLLKQAVAAQT
jgi:hypothetical protein